MAFNLRLVMFVLGSLTLVGCGDDDESTCTETNDGCDDAGRMDSGTGDAGVLDAGRGDSGNADAGVFDVGVDVSAPPPVGDYYVSMEGDDSNPGTLEEPLATMNGASVVAEAGDLIYVRGGVYSAPVEFAASGSADAPIRIVGYPGERAVFRGPGRGETPIVAQFVIQGDWVELHTVWVEYSVRAAVRVFGDNVTVNDVTVHQSGATGIHFYMANNGTVSNCLISLSYNSHDSSGNPDNGGDADGIAFAHSENGLITNTISWGNSDDGMDFWGSNGSRIENSYTFGNGYDRWDAEGFNGNGNGFKLGNCDSDGNELFRSVSYSNLNRGFDSNCAETTSVVNCSSFDDAFSYHNRHESNHWNNNVAVAPRRLALVEGMNADIARSNSWDLDVVVDSDDFQSLTPPELDGTETAAEAIALFHDSAFLRLRAESDLIDVGEDVGDSFEGAAPDLGAFESP